MSWVRLDDQFPNHAKIMSVGSDAFRLHVTAMCWSATQLTDGAVPTTATRQLGWFCADLKQATAELETAGLWDAAPGGWTIHDYLDYNPSREQVLKERTDAKERMRNKRGSSVEVRPNISRTSGDVQRPPSPSPSPSPSLQRDEGLARPQAGVPVYQQEPADPEYGIALSKLEALGMVTGSAKLELDALWPDLSNGRREWVDDAVTVAQGNNAHSPAYAIRVLAGAIRDNKRPGSTPERAPSRKSGGHTSADLDEIFGAKNGNR
jgi:hypothetical protein